MKLSLAIAECKWEVAAHLVLIGLLSAIKETPKGKHAHKKPRRRAQVRC